MSFHCATLLCACVPTRCFIGPSHAVGSVCSLAFDDTTSMPVFQTSHPSFGGPLLALPTIPVAAAGPTSPSSPLGGTAATATATATAGSSTSSLQPSAPAPLSQFTLWLEAFVDRLERGVFRVKEAPSLTRAGHTMRYINLFAASGPDVSVAVTNGVRVEAAPLYIYGREYVACVRGCLRGWNKRPTCAEVSGVLGVHLVLCVQ